MPLKKGNYKFSKTSILDIMKNLEDKRNKKIAILSGKGGAGKTLLAVNLAAVAENAYYCDCDVEEPNGHLFFKPEWELEEDVFVKIPVVDQSICDGCRKCVEFCRFNALAYVNGSLKIFEDICHSCGGCLLVCPLKALTEKDKQVGKVFVGNSEGVRVVSGMVNVGQASGSTIIKEVLYQSKDSTNTPTFIDCPPGSACNVMESISNADFCLMVLEPTIFGRHNFEMVYELVQLFNKPSAVIINKSVGGYNPLEDLGDKKGLKILGKIPYDTELSKLSSNAEIAVRENPKYKQFFSSLLEKIYREASI
ncbi:MAG: 4Fe-4S binding protein [Synergistaceae bacterium]|nr:4Fe-4S binding protein [Synergistaceae bacterium]